MYKHVIKSELKKLILEAHMVGLSWASRSSLAPQNTMVQTPSSQTPWKMEARLIVSNSPSPNQMIDCYQDPPKRRCYRTGMARPGTVLDNMAPNAVLWALALTMQA